MSRRRKRKLILIMAAAIFYITIAANYHKIKFAISMLRLYSHEKKAELVTDNKDSLTSVNNPLHDILVSTENHAGQIGEQEQNSISQNENSKTNSIDSSNTNNVNKKVSYLEILKKYNDILEKLSLSFESQLDALIQDGIKEYTSRNLSNSQLAKKYISIGSELEKTSDDEFNSIVKQMEDELKSEGCDISITKDIKKYYTASKDLKKTELINRGMKHMETRRN